MDDVIIIGGSFAGLAGALQLGRARRKVTVLDTGLPRNRLSRGADYLSNAAHEIVVCAACIPSAAQGAEGGDCCARSLGLCLCLRVLYLQQVAVRVQHFDQTDDATFVGAKRAFACARE